MSATTNTEFENMRLPISNYLNTVVEPREEDQTEYEAMRTSIITNGGFYIFPTLLKRGIGAVRGERVLDSKISEKLPKSKPSKPENPP